MSGKNGSDSVSIGRAAELLQRDFPDVTVSSLRFLEREGLLAPERKPGGHRLYSNRDLARARRIKQWQAERLPLREIRERLDRARHSRDLGSVVVLMTSMLLDQDVDAAMAKLASVYESGTPLLELYDEVITPVLRNIGDDNGNHSIPVDVQMELDQQLIAFLARATGNRGHQPGKPVVLAACPPWERHDMPLRMLVSLLTGQGADVRFIGAQVDAEFVRDAVTRLQPDYILVSLTVKPPASAADWFDDIASAMMPEQTMIIGGMASSGLDVSTLPNVDVVGMMPYADVVDRVMNGAGLLSG